MAGWCNTCRAARTNRGNRCRLCGSELIETPTAIAGGVIDLRAELADMTDDSPNDTIDHPVEMDLTELHQAGRTKLETELAARSIPFRWNGDDLIVPQHADPIVRELLAHRPARPSIDPSMDPLIADIVRAASGAEPTGDVTSNSDLTSGGMPPPMPRILRACAAIADWLIITLLVFIPAVVFLSPSNGSGGRDLSGAGRWLIAVGPAIYFGACVARMSSTPGKWLFRGEVLKRSGGRCDIVTAGVRAVVPSAVSIVQAFFPDTTLFDNTYGAWIGTAWFAAVYLPLVVDGRRRGLHDRLAGTEVVAMPLRRTARSDSDTEAW